MALTKGTMSIMIDRLAFICTCIVAMANFTLGSAVSKEPPKSDDDESISMSLRRATHAEIISSDIALRLAEMLFVREWGAKFIAERSPLVVIDGGDRWEVHSREGIPPGERLQMIIMKINGRIVELRRF
jgi:hypothetical protein